MEKHSNTNISNLCLEVNYNLLGNSVIHTNLLDEITINLFPRQTIDFGHEQYKIRKKLEIHILQKSLSYGYMSPLLNYSHLDRCLCLLPLPWPAFQSILRTNASPCYWSINSKILPWELHSGILLEDLWKVTEPINNCRNSKIARESGPAKLLLLNQHFLPSPPSCILLIAVTGHVYEFLAH